MENLALCSAVFLYSVPICALCVVSWLFKIFKLAKTINEFIPSGVYSVIQFTYSSTHVFAQVCCISG